jgi:hypothetical protein
MRYPKLVRGAKTPVRVVIESEDSNEFGERPIILDKSFCCNYQDSASLKYTSDKQYPTVSGTLFIDGDILESLGIWVPDFSLSEDGVLCLTASTVNDGALNYASETNANSDVIISGYVVIFGRRRTIVNGCKARNLDGSVNYTKLEVI